MPQREGNNEPRVTAVADPALIAAARTLATDRATGEVLRAWRSEGIEPILLKGVSVAEWLYPGESRTYGDVDMLVDPARILDAAAGLERLGFEPVPFHVSHHAHPWLRDRDGVAVDLHITLCAARRPPIGVWRELQRCVVAGSVGGCPVRMLDLPGRALLAAVHAAQHSELAGPREDLARAVQRASLPVWRQAELLADRLRLLTMLARGLRVLPAGVELLGSLPLARAAELLVDERAPLAIGFTRLRTSQTARERAAIVTRAVFPPTDEVLNGRERARGGAFGLALAYLRHAVWLAIVAAPTAVRLRRAGRRSPAPR